MADSNLKQRIKSILKNGYFADADDLVDVSDGAGDNVHVVIVSRKFDGRRFREKSDLIMSELTTKLTPEECGQITLTVGASPEEVKAI